jgi:hypothetical protein
VNFQYNFRLGPETLWLIGGTVLGTLLVQIAADMAGWGDTVPPLDDLAGWGIALAISAVRTLIGALLAVATGGGFQMPGQAGPAPKP